MERKLAAILAADVAGYSRLMGADETGTLDRLKRVFSDIVRPGVTRRKGRIVKLMGDGFLAEYASAVEAVLSAVDIQGQLAGAEAGHDPDRRILLRIGVNLGDIISEGGDIFGDGVNVAARLEAMADPGGVCISRAVHDLIDGKLEARFRDLGAREFKNIARPVRVFALETGEEARSVPATVTRDPGKPSIAVLAFADPGGGDSRDYLAEGISEDIITELSRFPELFVIAPGTSLAYRGDQAAGRIARELGVRYVLQGTIRRSGGRLRISARLLDSRDATQVWADRFDCVTADVFELQDDITRKVVGSIAPQIELAELARSRAMTGAGLSAYELACKGQAMAYEALRVADEVTLAEALRAVDAALELDPSNVRALWNRCLCLVYQHMYHWGDDVDALLDTVSETVDQLFKADGANAKAFMVRAWVRLYQQRFDAALADHHRALDLNPNLAMNLFAMSWTEAVAGLTREAREHAGMALRLSPREADVWLGEGYAAIAMASLLEGEFAEAVRWGNLAYQRQPGLQTVLVAANLGLGDRPAARHHFEAVEGFAPRFVHSCLDGRMAICKHAEHNAILVDALREVSGRTG